MHLAPATHLLWVKRIVARIDGSSASSASSDDSMQHDYGEIISLDGRAIDTIRSTGSGTHVGCQFLSADVPRWRS